MKLQSYIFFIKLLMKSNKFFYFFKEVILNKDKQTKQ